MVLHGVTIPMERVGEVCRRYGASRLSLFGSILGEGFTPESDVDMLVEFGPGVRIGLIGLATMEQELSDLIGRRVDLRTPSELSRYFREDVRRRAQVLHAA